VNWKRRAQRVLGMRVAPVYIAGAGVGLVAHRSSLLPYPEGVWYSAFFFLCLTVASFFYEWRGLRRPLWRQCLEGVAIGYVSSLLSHVAMELTTARGAAGLESVARESRLLTGFLAMPATWLAWIDGLLLGWFTWVSDQEYRRRRVLWLSSVLVVSAAWLLREVTRK
jgi:hypothetical protein